MSDQFATAIIILTLEDKDYVVKARFMIACEAT
jgi:hypothetical protein